MPTERWRDRVQKAWRDVDEARKWRQRVDDNDAEQRAHDAAKNYLRTLMNQPPMPPEVCEALRRLDEFCEDHPYALDDDPVLMARNEELQDQVRAAEDATGYRVFRGDRRPPSDSPPPDDGEVSGGWLAEQRAKTWGVIQSDGTVVAKGFLGDADAQEDMAVHPPGAIAVHGAGGWTNAATGHPASQGPARRPDEDPPPTEPEAPMTEAARTQPPEPPVGTVLEARDDFTGDYRIERTDDGWRQQYHDGESPDGSRTSPTFGGRGISWRAAWSAWGPPSGAAPFREVPGDSPLLPAQPDASGSRLDPPPAAVPYAPPVRADRQVCEPEKTTPPTGGTTTGSTGGTGMSIEAARAQIMGGHQTGQDALGAINQAHEMVGDARNDLWQATEGSNQAEAEPARAQLTEAMTKLEEAEQQVASALQEFENVANRL